jgi:hypothetical protein
MRRDLDEAIVGVGPKDEARGEPFEEVLVVVEIVIEDEDERGHRRAE